MPERKHLPKPKSRDILDWVECRCGWRSKDYWDDIEKALSDWMAHQAEVIER